MSLFENKAKIICPMCKIVAIRLVPMYDNDNAHKKQMACITCKRKIKNGEEIIKIIRDNDTLSRAEREFDEKMGRRQRVDVL